MASYGKAYSLLCAGLCWAAALVAQPQLTARQFFGPDYAAAYRALQPDTTLLARLSHQTGLDSLLQPYTHHHPPARLLLAVVFPEQLRYSRFHDFVETSALQLAYVQAGTRGANFSIGHYQMRPSYIEWLEQHYAQQPGPDALRPAWRYPQGANPRERRRLRLARLQQHVWQQYYLVAHWWLVLAQLPDTIGTPQALVRHAALRYNLGPQASPQALLHWAQQAAFPLGSGAGGPQFRYADVAADYLWLADSLARTRP